MENFIAGLFDTFQPHGQCLLWNPALLWLFLVSDLLITLSYYSIPIALFYFVRKRKDLQFGWIFLMFAGFIWACGTTHAMSVFTLWTPAYWIEGYVKLFAGIISMITAVQLWPLIPKAIALPSPRQLESMNKELQQKILEKEQAEELLAQKIAELNNSHSELIRQNSILNAILGSMNDGVAVVNTEGRYILTNSASEKILSHNLLGRQIGEIGFAVYADEAMQKGEIPPIARALRGEIIHDEERLYLNADGVTQHWLSINTTPVILGKNEQIGAVAVYRDITPRKIAEHTLRKSEARFRSIFEYAAVGIALFDSEGKIFDANNALEKISLYSRDELKDRHVSGFIFSDDITTYSELFTELKNKVRKTFQGECRFVRKDNKIRWVRLTVSFIWDEDGKPMFGIKMIEDITEEKAAKDKLEYYAKELERSNSDLEQFAYIASHDLREPLRMVTSYVQLLEKQYAEKLDADGREYMHFAIDGAKRMAELIESLLAYSRVSVGQLQLQQISSEELVSRAKENLQRLIEENSAEINSGALPEISVSPVQMVQVFQNLFANAIKFRKKGEPPKIFVSAKNQGNEWLFSVRDNGIGMAPDAAERIFILFQRLHTKEEYPGTGIGLSVVKKIIERHGGKIWVKSEPEKGSEFFFTIPKQI